MCVCGSAIKTCHTLCFFCFLHTTKGNVNLMAPCGSFSITLYRIHQEPIKIHLQVSHFFSIRLRLRHFDLEVGTYACDRYSSVLFITSHQLPWAEDQLALGDHLEGYQYCGRFPVIDQLFKNSVDIIILPKTYFITMEMTLVYTVVDMQVIFLSQLILRLI